ncbi:hypothetical protein [Paenibacillus sp. S150]|uniref:hypothetical protein n=1 Tax=Paenibacillus sp. S150 TaxID=2749826 RepID=UPI001C5676FF|nr:hypothetical protein [Paenibacillus sp. S150]MBW4085399.1 hypothetical protein [Paenibacillus sp. S150]
MKPIVRPRKPAAQRNRSGPYAGPPGTLLYRNSKYGFSIRLPRRWRCYTAVRRSTRWNAAEYSVCFLFKYKGKIYEPVLTLLVYRMTLKQWIAAGYDDSPITRLAVRNGRIYGYAVPGELPEEFLNARGNDYDYKRYGRPIRLLKRMVNCDVPRIIKTFRLR